MTEENHRELVTMPCSDERRMEPVALLYTDVLNDEQLRRDDLWAVTTKFLQNSAEQLAQVQRERDAQKREWEAAYEIGVLAKHQLNAVQQERDELLVLLTELREYVDTPPDRSCSCHISPPCNDCVNNSHLRDVLDRIAKLEGTKP